MTMNIKPTRTESAKIYLALCSTLSIPEVPKNKRQRSLEARAYIMAHEPPKCALKSFELAEDLITYLYMTHADKWALDASQVGEAAKVQTYIAANALALMGGCVNQYDSDEYNSEGSDAWNGEILELPADWRKIIDLDE